MTEKEKMLQGISYNSRDPELLTMYHKARGLLAQYNQVNTMDSDLKQNLLQELFRHKGDNVWIEAPFYCDYGENISIGTGTFIHTNCVFIDTNSIRIGTNGLIAPHVQIYTATHPLQASERIIETNGNTSYVTTTKPVIIGDNVWIGGNCVILPGVKIGNNVTIGAGSVVTKDIPNNVLALGNPCTIVKEL